MCSSIILSTVACVSSLQNAPVLNLNDSVSQALPPDFRLPGGSDSRENLAAEDLGSIPESGRSPEEGNGSPLQYSCLENPTDRGAWGATVHGVAKSQT